MKDSEFKAAFRSAASRRDFLRLGGLAATALAGAGLLSACSGSAGATATSTASAAGATGNFGTVNMQLGWIKNVQFCGEYMASQRNFYTKNGLAVNLVSGGAAATSSEAAISTGKAWVGTSKPLAAAQAIAKGVKVTIIGAVMQEDGHVIVSPADKPLKTPKDLIGKKVGVPLHDMPDFTALLKANNIDPSQVTVVPVQFDPSPLVHGDVDAWDGQANNEPVTLAEQGFKTYSFKFADFGLPMSAQVIEVATDTLAKERDKVKAFLTAEAQGWKAALADPEQAVKYCVDIYGKDLNLKLSDQMAVFNATIPLIQSAGTKKNGLMTLSKDLITQNVESIKKTGTPASADMFDLSVLEEVYSEHPDLV